LRELLKQRDWEFEFIFFQSPSFQNNFKFLLLKGRIGKDITILLLIRIFVILELTSSLFYFSGEILNFDMVEILKV